MEKQDKKSVLSKNAQQCIKKLVSYNGSIHHQKIIAESYLRNIRLSEVPAKFKKKMPYLGSKLIVRHPVTANHIWAKEKYTITGANVEKSIAELNRKVINYFVSQSYEALETYLYSVGADLCFKNKKKALEIPKMIKCADIASFRTHIKDKFRNIVDVYEQIIIKLIPSLQALVTKYPSFKNYSVFIEALLITRHAIVHSAGIIRHPKLKPLVKKMIIEFLAPKSTDELLHIDCTEHGPLVIETIMQIVLFIEHYP